MVSEQALAIARAIQALSGGTGRAGAGRGAPNPNMPGGGGRPVPQGVGGGGNGGNNGRPDARHRGPYGTRLTGPNSAITAPFRHLFTQRQIDRHAQQTPWNVFSINEAGDVESDPLNWWLDQSDEGGNGDGNGEGNNGGNGNGDGGGNLPELPPGVPMPTQGNPSYIPWWLMSQFQQQLSAGQPLSRRGGNRVPGRAP